MPFKKGKSGNPGGRPKAVKAVQDLARTHTKDAIATLARIMMEDLRATESGTIIPGAQIEAAKVLLDRAWGKPRQEIENTGPGLLGIVVLPNEED